MKKESQFTIPPFFLKVMFDIRVTVCFEKKHLVPVFGQMTNKQIM
jgi:hypothetical protein